MDTIVIDFETYYDKDYSLSKMTTDEYVLDPRFEVIGVSVLATGKHPQWFSGSFDETLDWLHQFDWGNAAVAAHNVMFDGYILTKRFGITPRKWMDTLGMMRRLYPFLSSHSLAALAKFLGLPEKGTEVLNALGKRRQGFSPAELARYAEYCTHDTWLAKRLLDHALPHTPGLELQLIDMFVRMFTEPMLVGDVPLLQQLYEGEVSRKEQLLSSSGLDKDQIMSNAKFAEALTSFGVSPPTKVSARTGRHTYAFAKTDKEFTALLEHDDPRVQAIVAARLGVKTTIAETRALRVWEAAKRGPLSVHTNFWGAKTTGRASGGGSMNFQNLPARGPSAGIREAIAAPEGHVLVVGDSSNIELRVAMAAAGQLDTVEKLRNGVDLYCDFASALFGRPVTKADKADRMLGKIAMLSLQYGAGWRKFREMVRLQGGMEITDLEAQSIVDLYRRMHNKVVEFWDKFNHELLPDIALGGSLLPVDANAWCLTCNNGFGVNAQSGVVYHNLRQENVPGVNGAPELSWVYDMGKTTVKIYGGKSVENFSQYVARMIVLWQTAEINKRFPVKLSVHDEAVCVVPIDRAEECKEYMEQCLSTAPMWCAGDIPLACEVAIGRTYADAK